MEKKSGIEKIKYGEVHIYYPLKFNESLSFMELCEKIKASDILYTEKYQEKVLGTLRKSMAESVELVNENVSEEDLVYLRMQDIEKYKNLESEQIVNGNQDIKIEIEFTESSIKTHVISTEIESLCRRTKRVDDEYTSSKLVYGRNYLNLQDRFLLLPLKIELNSQKSVWLYPFLYVFANGMGILKLELPLCDVDITPFKQNDINQYIKTIKSTWADVEFEEQSLESIKRFYYEKLLKELGIEFFGQELRHIIMVDYENILKSVDTIPNEIQEDLYKIIAAPVQERPCTSYKRDAQEYIKSHSFGSHNIKILVKSTGGCLSFLDKNLLDYYSSQYMEQNEISELSEEDIVYIYESLARDLQVSSEFALLIILLKKMNMTNDFMQKSFSSNELEKIRNEYQKNVIFICSLQEECFGSVSEQVAEFEKMMSHYMKQEITNEKLDAINSILKAEENKKVEEFQNFLSIGGFLLTLVFGLPSIYETFSILRECCWFLSSDIPILTLGNVSVIVWVVLNLFVVKKVWGGVS